MNRDLLAQILERYRCGDTNLAEAHGALKDFPSARLGGYTFSSSFQWLFANAWVK